MSNVELARQVLKLCFDLGVREIILCAGARNAPFVALLSEQTPFVVYPFFEERSGAFFALGKVIAQGRPVAVITTSGTAAAELLPATIEADHQGLPLLLITADRPRRYRGSGAPQTINQIGLYSHYVDSSHDIEDVIPHGLPTRIKRPVHFNVCFDEPLLDEPLLPLPWAAEPSPPPIFQVETLENVTLKMKTPLVLVGGLPASARREVCDRLKLWRRPLYLEAPSGLRGHPELEPYAVRGGEKALARMEFDGVIRVGSIPTLRLWRDLDRSALPVAHFSHLHFSGLPRERTVYPLASLRSLNASFTPWAEAERADDLSLAARRDELFARFPLSEPAWIAALSGMMPAAARVFVGNSLPIREWDFAAVRESRHEIFANRGVNGIDGLTSTFLGLAERERSNWCVLGDLSALYDLSAPWAMRGGGPRDLNLVIVNNGGGKIFRRMFHNPLFENDHDLDFMAWAKMWRWDYSCWREPALLAPNQGPRVIEIVPDNLQSESFWQVWEKK